MTGRGAAIEFHVLGPVRVLSDQEPAPLTGRLQTVLLCTLLARANSEVPVAVLTDALWPERTEGRGRERLQQHAHRLRRMLGETNRLTLGQHGYRLRVVPGELDAARFETLLADGLELAAGEPRRAAELFRAALELWRGEPFDGLDVPALSGWASALAERRQVAEEELYQAELVCGRDAEVIVELIDLARRHPLRERVHALLVIALYRAGRRTDALAAVATARDHLVRELGVEPGAELRALQQRMLAGEPVGPTRDARAEPVDVLAPPVVRPAQLPRDVPGFVGRAAEMSTLDERAAGAARVAVVSGTAGVGKTALAVHWAHRRRERFPEGQLYVDLRGYGPGRPLAAHDALAGFLRALGVDGSLVPADPGERAARFRAIVQHRRILVVLDNARSADQVRPVLAPAGSPCFVLVTSRDAMTGLPAAATRVDVNRLPGADALGLLRDLAGDRTTATDAAMALVDRCARLPLALRIAGELLRARGGRQVVDIVTELDRTGLDVLDGSGDPDTEIRTVFSWSYLNLPPPAARLFRLMGLHPGPDVGPAPLTSATPGAAAADTRHALAALVRAHLVEEVLPNRYGMHDLLRAYAEERAAEDGEAGWADAARRRMFGWYLAAACAGRQAIAPGGPAIPGAGARTVRFTGATEAMTWFGAERANLVAVVREAAACGEHAIVWRLAAALLSFFNVTKHWDDWITALRTGLDSATRLGDRLGEACMLNGLGVAYDDLGRTEDAVSCHRGAADLLVATGEDHWAAWNHNNLGVVFDRAGRFDESVTEHRAALALLRTVGDRRGEALSLNNLGDVYRQRGEFAEAGERLDRALELQLSLGVEAAQRFTRCSLGDLRRDTGDVGEALEQYRAALAISRTHGDRQQAALLLVRLADLSDPTPSAGAAEHLFEALDILAELGDVVTSTAVRARLDAQGIRRPNRPAPAN